MDRILACVHCANLREIDGRTGRDRFVCGLAEAVEKLDVVRGIRPQMSAYAMRAPKAACGPEGRLFVEIKTPEAEVKAEAAEMQPGEPKVPLGHRVAIGAAFAVGALVAPFVVAGGAIADRWRMLGAQCSAARQAWRNVRDNVRPEAVAVVALVAIEAPIEEAKAVQAGGEAIVNQEAMIDALADKQVAELRDVAAQMREQDQKASEPEPEAPAERVALAKPMDPAKDSQAAGIMACLVAIGLLSFIAAWILAEYQRVTPRGILRDDGTISRIGARDFPCCWDVPKGHPCIRCRDARCMPRTPRYRPARAFNA